MSLIIKALRRFFSPTKLKKPFEEKIRHLVNTNKTDWDDRAAKCAKSLLTAVCFRETALASNRRKDSMIYQPIGLYYSMFHISMAALWLNPRVKTATLTRIHHKTLSNLVKSELVHHGFVDSTYYDTLTKLRNLRESCNYQFGYQDRLDIEISQAIKDTNMAFQDVLKFIHQVLDCSNSLSSVQKGIADGFGDDILDSYLTSKHKERVINYLVNNGLSV
jgi:uncharacterized protein (UPF0332 family)